jgi:hypothetical protein
MRLDSPFRGGQSGPATASAAARNLRRAQAGNIGCGALPDWKCSRARGLTAINYLVTFRAMRKAALDVGYSWWLEATFDDSQSHSWF